MWSWVNNRSFDIVNRSSKHVSWLGLVFGCCKMADHNWRLYDVWWHLGSYLKMISVCPVFAFDVVEEIVNCRVCWLAIDANDLHAWEKPCIFCFKKLGRQLKYSATSFHPFHTNKTKTLFDNTMPQLVSFRPLIKVRNFSF